MEDNRRKYSLVALLLTLLLTVGTLALLLSTKLHSVYTPYRNIAQLKQDSIMFGGEFVMLGNTWENQHDDIMDNEAAQDPASPEQGEQPDMEADDMDDAGDPEQKTPPVVTQQEASPQKVKEKPKEKEKEKTGPIKENDKQTPKPKAKAKTVEPKEAKAATTKTENKTTTNNATSNRVKNAFGNGRGTGGGKQGSPQGNASEGRFAGKPGIGGLVGYTLEYWEKPVPNSKWAGKVVVRVNVNPRGQVTRASAVSASGELAAHPEVRRSCEQAALKSRFSVPKNTTTEGIGTVTYIWH